MGLEEDRKKNFTQGHICFDRKPHDKVLFDVTVSHSYASAIGTNTYIRCDRCGAGQDITDYGIW